MALKSIIDVIRHDGTSWLVIFVIISSLIEIAPIKINPMSWIFGWFSKKMNKSIIDRLDQMEKKLDQHISESVNRDIRLRRETILDFGNSCMNGRKHTKEEFDFIISECDKYESYCRKHDVSNGVATATIEEIRRIYSNCLKDNSFLQRGILI